MCLHHPHRRTCAIVAAPLARVSTSSPSSCTCCQPSAAMASSPPSTLATSERILALLHGVGRGWAGVQVCPGAAGVCCATVTLAC